MSGAVPVWLPVTVGIVLMILGISMLIAALASDILRGRVRDQLTASRAAVVVDNEVIASAPTLHAARTGNTHR